MKLACVAPDDLSTIIFCKTLCTVARETGSVQVVTLSPVGLFKGELVCLDSNHIQVSMARFMAPRGDLRYLWELFCHFRRGGFDAAITFTTKPNIYGVIAAKLAGVPQIILAVRGLGRTFDRQTSLTGKAMRLVVSQLYRLSCALCTVTWFTNPNDLTYFVARRMVESKKAFLTKNAVDLSVFHPEPTSPLQVRELRYELGLDERDRVVIMVARLIWSKGIKEFIEAAALSAPRLPDVRFVLVAPPEPNGTGSVPEAYLHDAERRLRNFTWLGFRKDVVNLYWLADLAVLPSWYKEGGYPRALLEPMAMGKPVIAGDTDDCRSPVEHGKNGYVVPVRDSSALASAISDIMAHDGRRVAFGQYSLRKAQTEYDDRVVVREVLAKLGIKLEGAQTKRGRMAIPEDLHEARL